jgi:hypothetical protein
MGMPGWKDNIKMDLKWWEHLYRNHLVQDHVPVISSSDRSNQP